MNVLLVILGSAAALIMLVVRSLAVDEIKGRVQSRISASVEATIASLPDELQDEWAEEWRAELAANITMPLTAAQFARGLRRSAQQLVADPALAPVADGSHAPTPLRRRNGSRLPQLSRLLREISTDVVVLAAARGLVAAVGPDIAVNIAVVAGVVGLVSAVAVAVALPERHRR